MTGYQRFPVDSGGFMEHFVITTGFSRSGWSRGLAALARDQFAEGVDEILETWRARAAHDVSVESIGAPPLERFGAWLDSVEPGHTILSSDERDLWLLDQWAEHYPQARFLLFYTDPETALIAALKAGADPADFLDGWRAAVHRLVRFQRRHRQRSLLLDAESARLDPQAMVEAAQRIGLMLRLDEQLSQADEDPVFERLVARRWLDRESDLALLQAELEAHAYPLGERPAVADPDVDQLLELYRREQAFHRRLTAERDEQARLVQENANAAKAQSKLAAERGAELERLQARLSALEAQHTALETSRKQLEASRKQLETSHKTLEATHKDTVEENELLLLQLHQVQEELESQFLQGKQQLETLSAEKAALAKDKEALTRDKATLTAARDEQSKLAAERGVELKRLQERLSALEAQHTALETSRRQLEASRKQLETSHKTLEATHKDTVEETSCCYYSSIKSRRNWNHSFCKASSNSKR
ncbi:coiled-coil domain-containing protein [Allochromatium vinosum]|uniref:Chromosome segregation ATPase-like protein n=1 Tax=Allochromatium vinosum (strain ATCC 17899 / DSM 180 / NBRC 103801 / NCIMB 10441 / D) TaxID=572477 RepID=D3RMC4_ALLVD|nr:hypothetical protein [Allochromatium vinosum]ADC61182.1 hypothetical protein Alvin_0215 [Allochromatium vinosum DSM 180]